MKDSITNKWQWCLAAVFLLGTSAAVVRAEEPGVLRIFKPREITEAMHSMQTSYSDMTYDVSDRWDDFTDAVYGGNVVSDAGPRAHFASLNNPIYATQVSHHGAVCDQCQSGDYYCDCPTCRSTRCHTFGKFGRCQHGHAGGCPYCGSGCNSGYGMLYYFKSKFGFMTPTGNGGAGSPYIGKYARVYPQDVNYFDQRDGQVWASQDYGAPMAVPLAPVVGHTYNYSVGIPASRLTPISTLAR